MNEAYVSPSKPGVVAVADHLVALLLVEREGEVLAVVEDHFEALIVDDGPEADVALVVRGHIGKVQVNHKRARQIRFIYSKSYQD